MRTARLILALTCLSWTLGCGRIHHARQCRALARFVNGRLSEIDKLSQGGTNPASYATVALRYDALGHDLAQYSVSDTKLKAEIPELVKVFSRAAGATRRAARAVKHNDSKALALSERELARIDQRHRGLVRKIDAICR